MSLERCLSVCLVLRLHSHNAPSLIFSYWLPGGKVDPGEDLKAAAIRETKEEAGIDVELTGILRIEYTPHHGLVSLIIIVADNISLLLSP